MDIVSHPQQCRDGDRATNGVHQCPRCDFLCCPQRWQVVGGSGTELGVAFVVGYWVILSSWEMGERRPMGVAKWTVCVEAVRPDGAIERIEIATLERDLSS